MKKRILLLVLLLVLCYAAAAVVPYAIPRPIDPGFAQSFSSGAFYGDGSLSGPDRAGYISDPQEAFALRLSLVETARESLILSTHSVTPGVTPDLLWGALLCAADRGVSVQIILDGLVGGLGHSDAALALSAHPNVELYYFNRLNLLRPQTLNSRLHDKYFIADGRVMLLGGRNIADAYFAPDGFEGAVSQDNDVLVWHCGGEPGVIPDVIDYFRAAIDHELTAPAFGELSKSQRERAAAHADKLRALYREYGAAGSLNDVQLTDRTVPTDKISFLSNPFTGLPKQPLILWQLLALADDARESVLFQSPYTVASRGVHERLAALAGRKKVELLTNSLASSPNLPAFSAYLWDRTALARSGVTIYEYQSADSIHGKSVLIDDRLSAVGSWNLDERSIDIDTEVMLVIDSAPFQRLLRRRQDDIIARSLVVGADGKYLPGPVEALPVARVKWVLFHLASPLTHLFGFLI